MTGLIEKYFPGITSDQKEKFSSLQPLYEEWNSKINVISRKDMDNFLIHHVLHSLSIARIISFVPGTRIIDAGTGGGFPGIPLAIMFPDARFVLVDSIRKKIKVVEEIITALKISNVEARWERVEDHRGKCDFIVSRAVTAFPAFVKMASGKISRGGINSLRNGIIYLKGGDISGEISEFKSGVSVYDISSFFSEPFFETKKIICLPV